MKRVVEILEDKYDLLMNDFAEGLTMMSDIVQYWQNQFGAHYVERGIKNTWTDQLNEFNAMAKIDNEMVDGGVSTLIYLENDDHAIAQYDKDVDVIKEQKIKIPIIIKLIKKWQKNDEVKICVLVQNTDYTYGEFLLDGKKIDSVFGRKVNELIILNHGYSELILKKSSLSILQSKSVEENIHMKHGNAVYVCRKLNISGINDTEFVNRLILLSAILKQLNEEYFQKIIRSALLHDEIEKIYHTDIIKKCCFDREELSEQECDIFFDYIYKMAYADPDQFKELLVICEEILQLGKIVGFDALWYAKGPSESRRCLTLFRRYIEQSIVEITVNENQYDTDRKTLNVLVIATNNTVPYMFIKHGFNPNNIDVVIESRNEDHFLKIGMNNYSDLYWNNLKYLPEMDMINKKYDIIYCDLTNIQQGKYPILHKTCDLLKKDGILTLHIGGLWSTVQSKKVLLKNLVINKFIRINDSHGNPQFEYLFLTNNMAKQKKQDPYWWCEVDILDRKNESELIKTIIGNVGCESHVLGMSNLSNMSCWKKCYGKRIFENANEKYVDQKEGFMCITEEMMEVADWVIKPSNDNITITANKLAAYEKTIQQQLDVIISLIKGV